MKYWWILFVVLSLCLTRGIYGAGFNLKSIGPVNTDGRQISQWWYSGYMPTLRGEADPNSEVTVTIDSESLMVNANSSGEWNFTPLAPLGGGDHQVVVENNGTNISFTLTLGSENVDWSAVETEAGESLPTVGFFGPTMAMMGIGSGLVYWSAKIGRERKKEKILD